MTDASDQVSFNPSDAAVGTEPSNPAATPAVVTAASAPAPDSASASAPATTTSSESEKPKAVFVENLSPNVTTKMLNEFFSLCGAIESITVRPKPNAEDGTLEAIVFFESSGAADTAVLLTNAILVDRNISISYFSGSDDKASEGDGASSAADGEENSPSVWASILAAGYKLGDNIQNTAMEIDQKYGVRKGFEDTMDKIDQTLGLTTKVTAFSTAVHQKSDELHVTEKIDAVGAKMTQAGDSIRTTANNVLDSAMQNEYVSSAWSTLSGWGTAILNSWMSVTEEANSILSRQSDNVRSIVTPEGSSQAQNPATVDATEQKPAEQPPAESPKAPEEPKPAENPAQ